MNTHDDATPWPIERDTDPTVAAATRGAAEDELTATYDQVAARECPAPLPGARLPSRSPPLRPAPPRPAGSRCGPPPVFNQKQRPTAAPPAKAPVPAPSPARPPHAAASPSPAHNEARRPASLVPASPHAPAQAPARALPPLPPEWKEPPRKREIPRRMRIGLIVAGGILIATLVLSRMGGGGSKPEPKLEIEGQLVVNEEDLKNRREISAADFRPKKRYLEVQPKQPEGIDADDEDGEDGGKDRGDRAERRSSRRASIARREAVAGSEGETVTPERPRPVLGSETVDAGYRRKTLVMRAPEATGTTDAPTPELPHVPAASTVPAVLVGDLEVATGGTTVVAEAGEGGALPAGTRFIGTATLSGSRVTLRFKKLVLPDGGEARVQAEAQDETGTFGIPVVLAGGRADPSVGEEVARDTASDVVTDLVGSGLGGRTVTNYMRRSRAPARWSGTSRTTARLSAGTELVLFFHEGVSP